MSKSSTLSIMLRRFPHVYLYIYAFFFWLFVQRKCMYVCVCVLKYAFHLYYLYRFIKNDRAYIEKHANNLKKTLKHYVL